MSAPTTSGGGALGKGQPAAGLDVLTTDELAELLKVKARTVRSWRASGYGPRPFRAGNAVRYSVADVTAWLEAQREGA